MISHREGYQSNALLSEMRSFCVGNLGKGDLLVRRKLHLFGPSAKQAGKDRSFSESCESRVGTGEYKLNGQSCSGSLSNSSTRRQHARFRAGSASSPNAPPTLTVQALPHVFTDRIQDWAARHFQALNTRILQASSADSYRSALNSFYFRDLSQE